MEDKVINDYRKANNDLFHSKIIININGKRYEVNDPQLLLSKLNSKD